MKKFFETKFKILPLYINNKKDGVIVYEREWISPVWWPSSIDARTPEGELVRVEATFSNMDEAMEYIQSRKTIY